jgi:hypothetical protein
MTIIVPFVGSLLLFNQHLVDLLTLSPAVVGRWLHTNIAPEEAARQITFSRLYFVYFGLSFLGMGSAIFAMLCPIDIKSNASVREYLQNEGELVTRARMGLMVPNIAGQFIGYCGDGEFDEKPSLSARLSEPRDFMSLYRQVIQEMYLAMQAAAPEQKGDQDDNSALPEDEYADHRGRPDIEKISAALYYGTGAHQYIVYEIQNLSAQTAHKNEF